MTELKPCPFCGSPDIYETYSQEYALGPKNPEIFCNTCKAIFSIEDDSPYMNCDDDFKYRKDKTIEAWNRRDGEADLPSVQPEQSSEIQDILDYLDTVLHPIISPEHWNVYSELHDMISTLPSAQPEIIACGDCKHWICHDRRCGYWNHGVKPLDWCCHAERRTDGSD